jgi:cell division protein FtsB
MAPQDTGQPATRYPRAGQGAGRPAGASATTALAPGTRQAGRGQPAVRQPAVRRPPGRQSAAGDAAVREPAVREPAVRQPAVRQPAVRQPSLRRAATARSAPAPLAPAPLAPARPAPGRPAPGQRSLTLPGARPAAGLAPVTAARVPRTRFILLVLGMLGGGLVCLLVINTTLATASFRINALQRGNAALVQQEQSLQQQVATDESPASLAQRARKLGLRTQPRLNVLNLRTGRIYRQPASLPGIPNVPGYAP